MVTRRVGVFMFRPVATDTYSNYSATADTDFKFKWLAGSEFHLSGVLWACVSDCKVLERSMHCVRVFSQLWLDTLCFGLGNFMYSVGGEHMFRPRPYLYGVFQFQLAGLGCSWRICYAVNLDISIGPGTSTICLQARICLYPGARDCKRIMVVELVHHIGKVTQVYTTAPKNIIYDAPCSL
jgi:hypothetical protein